MDWRSVASHLAAFAASLVVSSSRPVHLHCAPAPCPVYDGSAVVEPVEARVVSQLELLVLYGIPIAVLTGLYFGLRWQRLAGADVPAEIAAPVAHATADALDAPVSVAGVRTPSSHGPHARRQVCSDRSSVPP